MSLLRSPISDQITTKATQSVKSKCTNIKNYNQALNMDQVIKNICNAYWQELYQNWSIDYLFKYIDPDDPSIKDLFKNKLDELNSWNFVFGNTPKFELSISLNDQMRVNIEITNGIVKDYQLISNDFGKQDKAENVNLNNFLEKILGLKLDHEITKRMNINYNFFPTNEILKSILEFFNKNF
jgi:hypothetical protein